MILGIILKLLFGLAMILILVRMMGKKELSQANPVYYFYAVLLGGIVEETIYDDKVHVHHMAIAFAVVIAVFMTVEKLSYRFRGLERLIKGEKELLISDGKVNQRLKKREGLTDQDIAALLREQGVFSHDEVDIAYLEPNGKLTVKKR